MTGRFFIILLLLSTVVASGGMYYAQVYGYYVTVSLEGDKNTLYGTEIRMISLTSGAPEPIPITDFEGIDASSSPVRFRACFTTPQSPAELRETYAPYADPVPLTGPGWFDCYDARQIGADLEAGIATAYLSEANTPYGIDRVIAVYADGRAYAWHQFNICGERVYDGQPAPDGCPPPPESAE